MTKTIYRRAIDYWGKPLQLLMLFEEIGELQQAISKVERNVFDTTKLAEEIADVEIMLEQIKEMYFVNNSVKKWKEIKLTKLERMLNDSELKKVSK